MPHIQEDSSSDGTAHVTDPRPTFIAMFRAVRAYLLGDGRLAETHGRVATNPKGEATRAFDAEAERIALAVARQHLGTFHALSEEAGEIEIGEPQRLQPPPPPQWTLVLDPCDGSNNFRRGIRSVGFAVAALPIGAALDPENVAYAVCGDIFTGAVYAAARGQGATLDGEPCAASALRELRYAVLGANIGRLRQSAASTGAQVGSHLLAERAWRIVQGASTVRRTGASVLDLCYVAHGAYDAYVDLRDRLTPENFMAPALIIREAGGMFTDPQGQPLSTVRFTQPYSVLAAGNDALLAEMLRAQA